MTEVEDQKKQEVSQQGVVEGEERQGNEDESKEEVRLEEKTQAEEDRQGEVEETMIKDTLRNDYNNDTICYNHDKREYFARNSNESEDNRQEESRKEEMEERIKEEGRTKRSIDEEIQSRKEERIRKSEDVIETMDKEMSKNLEDKTRVREGRSENAANRGESTGGGGCTQEGWCLTLAGEGREQYETEVDDVGEDICQAAKRAGTLVCDVGGNSRQPGRTDTRGGQHSNRETSYPGWDSLGGEDDTPAILDGRVGTYDYLSTINTVGRATNDASRNQNGRAGTHCKQTKKILIGRTVKLNSGEKPDNKSYINP